MALLYSLIQCTFQSTYILKLSFSLMHFCILPFNASDKKNKIPVDFCAVDELFNIAGVHGLGRLQAARPYAVTHCRNKTKQKRNTSLLSSLSTLFVLKPRSYLSLSCFIHTLQSSRGRTCLMHRDSFDEGLDQSAAKSSI